MHLPLQSLALVDFPALGGPLLATVIYALVGILLMVLGFKVFDWITPRVDLQKELAEKHNIAVAIICGAVILGVACIVAVAVKG